MLIVNPLLETWREFQAILSDRAKYSALNLLKDLPNNITQSKAVINKHKSLDCFPANNLNNNSSDSVLEVNLDATLNSLKSDGFFLGTNLKKNLVQEIFKFATNTPCYGNGDKNLEFYYHEQEQIKASQPLSFANYANAALLCPGIQKLENDPILLEIAANYLETKPIHQQSQLWWNFPIKSSIYERRHAVQKFHYHHDYRRLRFVFYITDVDLCSSPHICVRGSHTKKKLAHRFITKGCSQLEIRQYYGYENIVPICGKAGFGFVQNPLCFHKENPPGSKDRLTLQIEFATKISE